jgi:long-chain acyl-CoA synthetase
LNLASLIEAHPASGRALCGSEGWFDWGEVRSRARSVALGLTRMGVGPGDRVALVWPTSVEFVTGYLGALAAGAVAVPLNPASPAAELEREISFVEPAAIICGGTGAETVESLRGSISAEVLDDLARLAGAAHGHEGSELSALERQDSDPAVMLFTSGTSGTPRTCVLTHGNLTANLRQMLAVPGKLLVAEDVGLAAVPFFHVFGLNVVLGLTIATGAALVCEERFEPEEALSLVEQRGVTVVAGAPPMYADWADMPDAEPGSFSKVRLLVSGAAALAPEVSARFSSRFQMPIWEGYGLTEASPVVSTSVGLKAPRPGSVGRPLPGMAIRLVDESGEDALFDDPGEIWVRGPNIFHGYWRDQEATAEVLDGEGWLHTGDVGVIDDSGGLHVVDRLKDLVIVSGFNVVPAEVERVIQGMDGVKEAVVIGSPDARTGESVEAVVVREPGSSVTAEEIESYASRHLAHYKVPEKVRFTESLPHGLAGKALRRAVRELG